MRYVNDLDWLTALATVLVARSEVFAELMRLALAAYPSPELIGWPRTHTLSL